MPDRREYELEVSQPTGRLIRRILSLARPYISYIAAGIAIGLVGGAVGFLLPLIEGRGVNQLLEAFEQGDVSWENFRSLLWVVGVLVGVGSFLLALRYCRIILASHLRMKILTAI